MARRGYSLLFASGLFISDLLAIILGFSLAFWLRFHAHFFFPFFPLPLEIPHWGNYVKTLPLVCFVFVLYFRSGGLYRESLSFSKIVRVGSLLKQSLYGVLVLLALSTMYRNVSYSRLFLILLFPLIAFLVILGRTILIRVENRIRKIQGKKTSLVVVGDGLLAQQLVRSFTSSDFSNYQVAGVVSLDPSDTEPLPVPKLGTLAEIDSILDRIPVDELIFSTVNVGKDALTQVITACDRRMIQFYIVPDVFDMLTSKVELTSVSGINMLGVQKLPLDNGLNRLQKRALDLLCSMFGLFFLSPLFLILILRIKMSSKGPIFFKQARCREDGKEFPMFKFRTMREDAETHSGPVFAKEQDARCTPIGAWMRSKNLDELPQLWNVFHGDMSLVGPRPERPHFITQFKFDIPRYMSRHRIKPGITGWAQVNGWRGNTSLEERIKYDVYYIENWSLWLDLKILFLTFFSYKNAY